MCKFGYDIDEIFEFEEKIKNTIENKIGTLSSFL